jgi:hypothetical protein
VAQVEFSVGQDLEERIRAYHARAVPLLTPPASRARESASSGARARVDPAGRTVVESAPPVAQQGPRGEHSFLLIPASEAGKSYGELALKALSGIHLVNVPGQADLTFCREQGDLSLEDVEKLLAACRAAYAETAVVPQSSPHARFDIQDWVPLDP